ncbi:primase-helicase family protein [Chryseobacterium sp. FH1]|uniref:primase-helicase family protein n=1 Tax=Chryseobacterium sp. FH1 TaxID=1233951 RepID=UPI0004E3FC0E|nr:primase-helicase family protein [Chryseobacterium sp. FH1]KFC19344.1 hypothetical protein IO90_08530 [Chryseobacterium sp. FH1]
MSFLIKADDVLSASNGGLEIFLEIFNIKDPKKHFQIRDDDDSFSAKLRESKGVFWVKDYGDVNGFYSKSKDAINAYAHERALSYFEALRLLASQYGVISEAKAERVDLMRTCRLFEYQGRLNAEGYEIKTKEFTAEELQTLGPLVTAELCKKMGFHSVAEYSWLKEPEEGEDGFGDPKMNKVITKRSDDSYPIFAYIEPEKKVTYSDKDGKPQNFIIKEFAKILQPKDTKFRFRYFGSKGQDHIFGMDFVEKLPKPMIEKEEEDDEGNVTIVKSQASKHPRLFICSGERDSINMASTGAPVVWFNSETANINPLMIKKLYTLADEIINVPDIDPTGIEASKKLALEFINIRTVWLPESLTKKNSWKGKPLKDFTDYVKELYNPDDENNQEFYRRFNTLVDNARPAKFWDEARTIKDGKAVGPVRYNIHYLNAFHFLTLNGFYRMRDPHQSDLYYFVRQDKHIIKPQTAQDIKSFFIDFLLEKQKENGKRFYPDELINMLYASEAVSDKKLSSLELKDFDFSDNTESAQYMFFDKFIWQVTKDGVKQLSKGYPRYVYEENILNNIIKKQWRKTVDSSSIKIEEDYFKIFKDKEGNWDIIINEKNCDFLNYLINASRVHHKKERERVPPALWEAYIKKNKFSIDGGLIHEDNPELGFSLTKDEIYEQKMHLINKIFSYGYLGHNYKQGSKAWMVYAMDNEVSEEGKSEGRTGKSLMLHRAMFIFKKAEYIGSRNPKVIDNEFLFGRVTEHTKYLLFDDAHKTFPFNRLFTWISGDLNVSVKNKDGFVIPFFNSGKFAYSTNFAPLDLDDSTKDRILFMAFSNWYHGPKPDMPAHKPINDFGYEFFNGWDKVQWNKFFNCTAQCWSFFLSTDEKIGAPENNIRLRNIMGEMGVSFYEWALDYFAKENLNRDIIKKRALEDLTTKKSNLKNISSTEFKKRLEYYCEISGLTLNPATMITDKKNNRIMRFIENQTQEVLYVTDNQKAVEAEELI